MWDGSYNTVYSSEQLFLDSTTYSAVIRNQSMVTIILVKTHHIHTLQDQLATGNLNYTLVLILTLIIIDESIANRTYTDGSYYTYGNDSDGNEITGSYNSSNGIYDI